MDIVLHWDSTKINFVNQEIGKSAKHRVGHKPSKLLTTTTISLPRERIDIKFKKILESMLIKVAPALHTDLRVRIYVEGKLFILSARQFKQLSNDIANVLIKTRWLNDKGSVNTIKTGIIISNNKTINHEINEQS